MARTAGRQEGAGPIPPASGIPLVLPPVESPRGAGWQRSIAFSVTPAPRPQSRVELGGFGASQEMIA